MYKPPTIESVLEAEIRNQVNKHKWVLGERQLRDPGFNYSLDDWIKNHFSQWAEWFISPEAGLFYEIVEITKYMNLTEKFEEEWIEKYAASWRKTREDCTHLVNSCINRTTININEIVYFFVPKEKEPFVLLKTATNINARPSSLTYEAYP
jgi:hypothetical protein